MASGELIINIGKDVHEIFRATRVINCTSIECKNNMAAEGNAECRLKCIYMLKGGVCEQFEEQKKHDPS